MNQYTIDNYNVIIGKFKNKVNILIKDDNNNYIIKIDKYADTLAHTSCENNIVLSFDSSIYEFMINCFEKKPFYDIIINFENDNITLNFIFKYELFEFSYNITLDKSYD